MTVYSIDRLRLSRLSYQPQVLEENQETPMPMYILVVLLCLLAMTLSQVQVTPFGYLITQPTYIGGCNFTVYGMNLECRRNDLLTDDVTDIGAPFDIDNFMGWNKNFTLKFDFGSRSFEFAQIDIYFYNNPSAGYGLPAINTEISFNGLLDVVSNPVLTTFIDNSEFSQTNNGVDMVSLVVVTRIPSTQSLFMDFVLNDYAITQTFISEIQVFTGTSLDVIVSDPIVFQMSNQSIRSGPDAPTPSLQMSCTITNNGTFSWTWTGPAVNTDRALIQFADLSRTSILTISRISSVDAGIYTCTAGYFAAESSEGVLTTQMSSSNISLSLMGSVNASSSSVVEYVGNNITLHCIFYGYLPVNYDIIWRKDGGMSLDDEAPGEYIISEDFNGNGKSQNGGSSIDGGILTELMIVSFDARDNGNYTCEMNGTDKLIATIQIIASNMSSSATSSIHNISPSATSLIVMSPSTTAASDDSTTVIFIVVICSLVLGIVILLAILLTIILLLCYKRRRQHIQNQTVNKRTTTTSSSNHDDIVMNMNKVYDINERSDGIYERIDLEDEMDYHDYI